MDLLHEISPNPGLDVVRIVITDNAQRILLVVEVDDPNWKLPGGKIEQGESVLQAIKRELTEELGILISTDSIKRVIKANIPDSEHYRYITQLQIDPGGIKQTDEVANFEFFSIENLPETKFKKHISSAFALIHGKN